MGWNPFKSVEKKIKDGFNKLGGSIRDGVTKAAKKIESEVINRIKKEGEGAVKKIDSAFTKELPKHLSRVTDELEKKIKNEFEEEFKKQIVGRLFGVGEVGIKHGRALNKLIPTSSLTIGVEIAGTGVTFSWEGQEHVAAVIDRAERIVKRRSFKGNEVANLLIEVLPQSMSISVGGSVTPSALVIGTEISLSSSFTVEKDKIKDTIKKLPTILATLSQMPNDVLRKVILNK